MKDINTYKTSLSVDLRCFDNSKPDMGVGAYVEKLGFIPYQLFNHETYMDQIHTHNGIIDDTMLEPQWVSQRAMPGAQTWTKRQFRALIEEVHKYGIKFFQGCEAAWSCWPEYGYISKCVFMYEHMSEVFIVDRTGRTSGQDGMGAINPLRRLKDGTLYEDKIIRDVQRFLIDYNCDGFFAADGFAGLAMPLYKGCYAGDMIEQFAEYTGIRIPDGGITEKADYIWEKFRYEWTVFYSDRWASFASKLSRGMKKAGKGLTTFTPWQLGPADSLSVYGYDYAKCARAGIDSVALEIMEEVTSRRFQVALGWESVGICSAATAKAASENLEILWTTSTCNCPEHWHTLRDQPVIIERECLALGSARAITSRGERIRVIDGVLAIFGIDLFDTEWRWLKRRWDEGFGYQVKQGLGPIIVWSDNVLYGNLKRGITYPLSRAVTKLRYAGIPVSQAVSTDNLLRVSGEDLLLVQPLGIDDDEVIRIETAVNNNSNLYVIGEVEHPRLLELLGIKKTKNDGAVHEWKMDMYTGREQGLEGYAAGKASCMVKLDNGDTALSVHDFGKGKCVFIRRIIPEMPALELPRTAKERQSYPSNMYDPASLKFGSIREQMASVITLHPDTLDTLAAGVIQKSSPLLPVPSRGQLLGFNQEDGSQLLLVENSANLMYSVINVKLPGEKKTLVEFPEIKPIGPVGYVFFGEGEPDEFDVCVPPDACIPVKIIYKEL
ncbi:MAG: hypothetical protein LBK08_06945 [Treponema sp.]|jgi:hypothetical protein|nr:hypothetical protein [Treponema sp.]